MKSQKHISGKKKLAFASKEESRIQKALHVYNSRTRLVGNGLPYSTRVYRVKVVTAMLKAGVPLSMVSVSRLARRTWLCTYELN